MPNLRANAATGPSLFATIAAGGFAVVDPRVSLQAKTEGKAASRIGCIREESGRYSRVNDRERKPIGDLEAAGFLTEGFARHFGKAAIAWGISISGDTHPRMEFAVSNRTAKPVRHSNTSKA
jgi:hypothetical protein